ncbi:MAG: integrase [Lentimonas sp.]|jgi:integrase
MSKPSNSASFQKVAECLYRNESSGGYYALVKKSGKQIRRSLKTKDRKLADRRLREFREQVTGLDFAKGNAKLTFDTLAKRWYKNASVGLKPSSALRKQTCINSLTKYFKGLEVRKITRLNCDDWAQKRSPKVAATTYNYERESLVGILDYAMREGIILANPALVTKRRKLGKVAITIPSKEQFELLIKTLKESDIRYQAAAKLVQLLAYSGMRKAEANAITWADVDFNKGSFTVTGGELGTKNHEARIVPLFPALTDYLKELRAEAQNLAELEGRSIDAAPIVAVKDAKKALMSACKKAELSNFTHHTMRHYFVSNAIEKGIDFKTIAAWVGHKDGGLLVAKTYGHLRDTHSFEMAKLMT